MRNKDEVIMRHKFVVIEGPDGSGKTTQCTLLQSELHRRGYFSWFCHLPRLEVGVAGGMIADFLRGDYGSLDCVHPKLVSLLFALDRKDLLPELSKKLQFESTWVLMDRYIYSNIAFQAAKIANHREKQHFVEWLIDLEFGQFELPVPDVYIYLDVPLSFLEKVLELRVKSESRGYLKGVVDIHEVDFDFQKRVMEEYKNIKSYTRENGGSPVQFEIIQCYDDVGNMKPIDVIHNMIVSVIFGD